MIGIGRIQQLLGDHRVYSKRSYSQCGEDLIVEYVFRARSVGLPTYLDIGAHHPYYLSNTARFYLKGCRGINIEANPVLLPQFHKHRPKDINLNIGIGGSETELDFHVMEDNTLSTFSTDEVNSLLQAGQKLAVTKKIRIRPIRSVLDEHSTGTFPDFLSLDAEGMDLAILRTIDFSKSFPKVICVEAAEYSPTGSGARRNDIIEFLISRGYFEYANTNLNAIMVSTSFWERS
jgi:FkbM family methyltransferase